MKADLQQEFIRDMLTESYEGLDRFDEEVLLLEKGAADAEVLNDIFRIVHTLKGTAGCLGFVQTQNTAHAGESLLDLLRAGKRDACGEVISLLFALSDALRARLQHIEEHGSESDAEDLALIERFEAAVAADPAAAAEAPLPEAPEEPAPEPEAALNGSHAPFGLFDDEPETAAAPTTAEAAAADGWGLFDDDPTPAAPAPAEAASPAPVPVAPAPAAKAAPEKAAEKPAANRALSHTTSVRVDVDLLDGLMNLVGELVLTRNQLLQISHREQARVAGVKDVSQRLNLITSDLQEGIMKTRMQPINVVWSKFPRIVRDIAQKLGKQVRFETFGSETELDRTIVEAIRDPLTHLVRNAIDHGLESPEERLAAGKSAEGFILMRAFHEGGQVNLEIIDDGAGIRLDRVRDRALERGLVKPDELMRMSDRELANLIFTPGFSTAQTVSDVSGRGVGMDVVRTNIEKIGGSVDLLSRPGEGTTVKIKIPLTLAIIPALIVQAQEQRFAIPQVNLVELVRLDPAEANQGIEEVYGAPVFRLRGRLLPLVYLRDELGFEKRRQGRGNIVVLRADDQDFGLVVDSVNDTEEIVVKPLSKQLKNLPMFAGATIMGDGRVALIMDLMGLAERARVLHEQGHRQTAFRSDEAAASAKQAGAGAQILLFSLPGRPRLALDLAETTRLEQFPREQFERSGNHDAVQYRGGILPVVHLSELLPAHRRAAAVARVEEPEVPVIVCRHGDRLVGLAVEEIRDIVESDFKLEPGSAMPGTLGSAIIGGEITDVVDLPRILRQALRESA